MKKWLLTALCSLVAGSALAGEWYFLNTAKEYTFAWLYDRSSLTTENGVTRVWQLSVNNSKQAKKAKSDFTMFLIEMDCKRKMSRYITYTDYLNGDSVFTSNTGSKWEYDIPDTVGGDILAKACARNKDVYMGKNMFDVAKQIRKRLDEELAKSTPQKNPASF